MKKIIEEINNINLKASKVFIKALKECKFDFVCWDGHKMYFDFGECRISLWIANDDYGLKIESPFYIGFTDKQKKELNNIVKVIKLTNKEIGFKKLSNDLYWEYTCVCGERLKYSGYNDDNWWDNIAPKSATCKCGLIWKLDLKNNWASILYKDYIQYFNEEQIKLETKKREEYEKAKEIVDNYNK